MSGSRTSVSPGLNNNQERELLYCYECSNEFYKDGPTGLRCPECGSDFVQIIEADFDPREEERADIESHTPWPDDPPEEDFDSWFDQNYERNFDTSLHPPGFQGSTWQTHNPPDRGGPPYPLPPQLMGNPLFGDFTSMLHGIHGTRGNSLWGSFDGPLQQQQQQQQQQTHSLRSQSAPGSPPRQTWTASGPGWTFHTTVTGSSGFNGGRDNQMNSPDVHNLMQGMFQQIGGIGGTFGPNQAGNRTGPGVAPQNPLAGLFNMLLNPANAMSGDAVFSQEAFDRVMSQLMEEHTSGSAPGPASEAAIRALPKKTMTESMMDETTKTAECSICMEQVEVGTEIATLPCTHWFHFECVESWLKEHDTCPVCRRGITPKEGDRDTARSPTQEPLHDEDPFFLARQQAGTREHPFIVPESPTIDRRRPNPRRHSSTEQRSSSRRSSNQNNSHDRNEGSGISGRVRNFFTGSGGSGSGGGGSSSSKR